MGTTSSTVVVVSHDRKLLNMPEQVYELSRQGKTTYGGNYEFYAAQKVIENNALLQELRSQEKALRKAREVERETMERQQKLDARGKKLQEKAGLPTIAMNTFRNNAEKRTSRIKAVHNEKVDGLAKGLNELRKELPGKDKMKLGFDHSALHKGKILFSANGINYGYGNSLLWEQPLNLMVTSGERVALKGSNGSGKTTLIKIIIGEFEPQQGTIFRAENEVVYIDQDYSLIDNQCTVFGQAAQFNINGLQEYEVKTRLTRFLFEKNDWDKYSSALSGGEKMRLVLCCLTIRNQAPDIIILDGPTNNLDLQNIDILTLAINEYEGTLVVVCHDQHFLEAVSIERTIELH